MKHIWVSTDWHLYNTDGGDIRHPFKTERIIQAIEHTFAQMIDSSDLFIFLGDLCDPDAMTEQELRRVSDLIHNIPGTKVMCRGNHDTLPDEEYRLMGFDYVTDLCRVHHMIFSHHPVRIAPDEINIHGHLHTDRYSAIELGHYQYVNAYGVRDEKTKSPYPILVEDLLDKVIDQHDNPEPDWGKKFESGFEKYTDLITCLNTSDDRILDLSNEILLVPEDDEPINESIGTAMVSLSASTEEDEKEDHTDDEILDEILFQDVDQTKYWEADDDSYQKHLDGAQYSDDRPTSKVHGKNDVIAERDPFINEAATAMKPPKIDETLEEILLLNNRLNQMKYGLHTKLGIKSDSSSEEFSKQYHVASPSEFLGHDGGVCWDFATYEDSYFITHFPNMKYKTWYIIFDDSQYYPTHTFLTFQYNGYHFYFESSFLSLQGVWYSKKEADLINFVLDGMNRHDSLHSKKPLIQYPYYVFQYDAGHRDIPGMDTKEFMDFVEKTGKRRRHKFTHNFRVNQLQFILSETANITQIRAVGTTLSHPGTENQRRVTKVLYQDGSRNIKTVMSFAEDILDGVIRIAPETLETERLKNINDIDTFVGYLKELNTHWGKISKGYPDLPKMLLQLASDTVGIKDAFPTLVPFNIKDEAMFRGWLDARIEELQDVEELLSDALMINLRSLVVNEVIAKQISETTDKKRHIKVLKTEIDRIRDNVTTKNRDGSYTIDYSAIQRGQVLISGSIYDDPEMNRVLTLPSRYVARLTMYDYIVVTHGTGENGVWKIDPVTYHGKTYTDPVKLLDKLTVNNQYVLLMACNPDGVELTNRYPTVDYADTTVLFESSATVTVTDNIADMPIKALISMKKEYLKHQIIVVNKLDKLIKKGVINDRYFLTPPDQITLIGGGKRNPILEKTVISVKTENDVMETYHRGFKVIFSVYKSVLEAMFIVLERASNIYHSGTTRAGDGYIVETFHNYSWCSVVEDTIVDPFHSFSAWIDKMYDTRAKEVLVADSDPKRKVLAESMDSIQDLIFMNEMCNSDSTAHGTDYVVRKFKNSICESTDTITSHEFENVHIGTDPDQPEVYFTSQITPDALVDIYHRTGFHGADALVKISSGEPGKGPRYCLDPDLIGLLLYHIHGTIGECNVGYEGPRYQTETHLKVLKDHGYTEIAPCDILDSMGEISLPVENGYHLKEFVVGSHLQDYGTIIVLSHFKGHPMAGFGGALKNVAIGFASSNGKRLVHSGGTTTSYIAGMGETNDPANIQEIFLQSMADGNAAFQAWAEKLGVKVLYINIANNISVDCDCVAEPEAPTMSDIGIFASYDPVAVDQACIDFVYGASDSQHVIERIEERHGLDLLEYAAEKNLGSRNYKLVTIDEMNETATFRQVKKIVDHIPKEEHHWFYHGDSFKDSPYVKYRDVMHTSDKKHAGFIDVYAFDSDPDTGIVVIALEPEARGTGIATKLVQKAIQKLPSLGIKKLIWRADTDNTASIKLAQKLGFHDISDLKANPDQYKYEYLLNETATNKDKLIDTLKIGKEEIQIYCKASENPNDPVGKEAHDLAFYLDGTKLAEISISAVDSNKAFLYNFEVTSKQRGKGYGTAILKWVLKNYKVNELTVDKTNTKAIKLYKRFGFKPAMDFKEDGKVRVDMKINLNESSLKEYKRTDDNGQLSREEKKKIADKYGLRAVGQVDADEEEERRKTPEQRLEEKRKKQLSTLKKARKVKKRKAMVRKIKSHLPFKSQNEDTAVDDTDVPGMEVEDNPLYGQRKHFFYNYDMPKPENAAAERLSESTSETTVLYHGSPMSLDVLKANSPLVDNKGKYDAKKRNVLYASPDKIFSLAYAGGHWTDLEINQSIVNDKMVLTEIVPGALDKAFNRPGYLYELSCDGFTRLNPHEFYSLTYQEPIKKTRIPNVMKALKKEGVEFYRYPNLPKFIPSRYEYLKDRCNTFGIDLDTTISMAKSAGAADLNLAIQESYKFELNNKQLHFVDPIVDPISESTTAKNEQLYPVYVMLVHSGTTVSNVIKTVSKSEYSHASISFDSSMRQMYSFARKDPNNPFIGGFRYETIGEGFYEKKEIPYAVYVVPCTESQIKKMKKRLAYFEKNKDKFTFDFSGLVTNYLGIVNNPAHRWFCSRFVSDILNAGTKKSDPYVPEPSLMDPDDFKHAVFAHYVTSGKNLMWYDTKKVDKITRKILREERMKRMAVTENVIFNLDFNDPYTETVIGYQLAMMDESVVNQFLDYLKSFHVRLDKDGNVILTRRVYTELDHHFHQTQKMLKMEKKSGDIEGMKLNLAKLHYMVGLIDEQYLKNRTVSRSNTVRKDMIDLRSVMMNTFQHYLKYIEELDPSFNFQSYYDSSIYGKETKIPLSAVTAIGKSFKTLL